MTLRNSLSAVLIPNEVLSDISGFVPNYNVADLTFISKSFAAATAHRLKKINEEVFRSKMVRYVKCEREGVRIELMTNDQHRLELETLTSAFPAACGLKYKPTADGDFRALRIRNKEFQAPEGGWTNRVYTVIRNNDATQSRSPTPIQLATSADLAHFSKYVFYTRVSRKLEGNIIEEKILKNSCAPFYTTLHPKRFFAISTRHGPHECLELGDEVTVYNDRHVPFKVKVILFSKKKDFILFDSKVRLCANMPIPGPVTAGCRYVMLGFAELNQHIKEGEHITPSIVSGIVMSSQPNEIGHVCGSSGGATGFSGGPIFDLGNDRLIGICVSTDDLQDRDTTLGQFSTTMIQYCKEITIVRFFPVEHAVHLLDGSDTTTDVKRRRIEDEGSSK